MSFDDRLRESLDAAGRGLTPAQPPVAELVDRAHRRRRAVLSFGGGACVVAIALIAAFLVARDGGEPRHELDTASQSDGKGDADSDVPSLGIFLDPNATTSTTGTGATTASTGSIAPSGTASAPPASVVVPHETTTTQPRVTPTTAPPTTGDIVVTQADGGKTFTLHRGQRLVVNLSESGYIYSEPDTDNPTALPRLSGSADPSTGAATATFKGNGVGQAHVSASKDLPCRNSNPPCMAPTQLWQITVNVV